MTIEELAAENARLRAELAIANEGLTAAHMLGYEEGRDSCKAELEAALARAEKAEEERDTLKMKIQDKCYDPEGYCIAGNVECDSPECRAALLEAYRKERS